MAVQSGEDVKLKKSSSWSHVFNFKTISFLLVIIASVCIGPSLFKEQLEKCPFTYVYHFGDGITDIGNSIYVHTNESIPAQHWPYGINYPGKPTGRWCDGRIDFDYTARDFGVPIVPYLESGAATKADGVIFSVARSTVLSRAFFSYNGVKIPSYAVSLETQMIWFKTYLKTVCGSTTEGCADRLADSLVLMGDIEGNDLGYALTQGKSIDEVKTYVPFIIKTMIDASRELIELGATQVIIPGNGPLGCYPYVLTALQTDDPTAYDELGCLKSVNDLVVYKNNYLQQAIADLRSEFPETLIYYGPMFDGVRSIINETSVIGEDGINKALKSCCGIGGKYNYDSQRFCGSSSGVPVCSNASDYIYWDGLHFTQQAYYRMEHLLVRGALVSLRCRKGLRSFDQGSSLSATF